MFLGVAVEVGFAGEGLRASGAGGAGGSLIGRVGVDSGSMKGRCWGVDSYSHLGVEAGCWGRAWVVVADAVGGSGEGSHHGKCRVRMLEASTHEGVHGSCWCRWCPGVGTRCSWESDAVIVSGAGRIGASVQRRRVRIDEGSKGITVRVGCRSSSSQGVRVGCSLEKETSIASGAGRGGTCGERRRVRIDEWSKGVIVRMGIIARCSKRLISIVVTVAHKADTVVFREKRVVQICVVTNWLIREGCRSEETWRPIAGQRNSKKKTYPGSAAALARLYALCCQLGLVLPVPSSMVDRACRRA